VGLLYAVLLPMFPRKAGLWSGLITPLVWSALIASTLNIINPTLNERVDWTWFVASQVAFGLVCGYVVARSEKIETMQTWTFSARAGVEAPGQEEGEE
jgi:flagellar biosynthesis protein FliR